MFDDLRTFLRMLEDRGELVRVKEPIHDGHEIFSILWRLTEISGPAVIFEDVAGYDIPVVSNIFGTLDRFALACGFPEGKNAKAYRDLFLECLDTKKWTDPKIVKDGPCKEIVIKGDDVDLNRLPILKWHPDDGGPYTTMPIVITEDDKFGVNASIYRMMTHDKNSTGMMCNIFQDQGIYLNRARAKGMDSIPCAVAIGTDPSLYVGAVTKIPLTANELAFSAALRGGRPVDVVKCETNDLYVPASAEIVLEGEISTGEVKLEGPYGEWMGYFEEEMLLPIFTVKCITHRKDPLYLMTIEGPEMGDAEILRMIPQMTTFTQQAMSQITGCKDVWLPPAGRNYTAIISVKKRYPGWGRVAAYQALALPFVASSANCVIVVDDDVDPSNLEQVIWSLSTRVDPIKDIIITDPIGGYGLNPAGSRRDREFSDTGATDIVMRSIMAIDATLQMEMEGRSRPSATVVGPKKEMFDKVLANWKKYGFE